MIWLLGYIASIFAANWLVATVGVVPVWPGIYAPAAVYMVGLSLTLRDLTQEALGKRATFAAIIIGATLSALVSPQFAVASGVAFLFSETADFLVYTPLHRKRWLWAVGLSNAVGLVIDSLLFLTLAFGSLAFLPGQIIGKVEMTIVAIVVLYAFKRVHKEHTDFEPEPEPAP